MLIVVGGAVVFILAFAGFLTGMMKVADFMEARLGKKPSQLIGHGFVLALFGAAFVLMWYAAFAWLMGWPL